MRTQPLLVVVGATNRFGLVVDVSRACLLFAIRRDRNLADRKSEGVYAGRNRLNLSPNASVTGSRGRVVFMLRPRPLSPADRCNRPTRDVGQKM